MKRICINPKCGWVGKEDDCMDYKHPVGARLCPECYEVTEEIRPTPVAADASPVGFEDEEFDALLDSDIDGK